jgi:hypothetical protein
MHRLEIDSWYGQGYIYIGGSLPAGTRLAYFQYLFDIPNLGGNTGYITPLLFERTPGETYTIYTVAGIGKGFGVKLNSLPGTLPFDVLEGIKVPSNSSFTFGFINAIVNSDGTPLLTSLGTVDMDALAIVVRV